MTGIRDIIALLGIAAAAFLAGRELFPKKVPVDRPIPVIVTEYDTVSTVPKWLSDSLKRLESRLATRDTVEIVTEHTLIDTVLVPVPCNAEERPSLWPVRAYSGGTRQGDTAIVTTFSLRTGQGAVSKVYIPGILTALVADTISIPKMIFEPFPEPKGPSLFYRLKLVGLGALGGLSACALTN